MSNKFKAVIVRDWFNQQQSSLTVTRNGYQFSCISFTREEMQETAELMLERALNDAYWDDDDNPE